MNLLIYTPNDVARETYIFQHIFKVILGIQYNTTSQAVEFVNYDGPKISYCENRVGNELHFKSSGFLSKKGIYQSDLEFADYKYYSVPFAVADSVLPFDVFAASFYLISRYEEYLPSEKDKHDRFSGANSLAFKCNFLHIPVIDNWAFDILKLLQERYPNLQLRQRTFIFQPTLDIDMPFYLKSEGVVRRILKSLKYILKGQMNIVLKDDPFDNYTKVSNWDQQFGTKTIYFMLMGNLHRFDVPIHKNTKPFYQLIQFLSKQHVIGLHPSYQSNINPKELSKEKRRLEKITNNTVVLSRQHYLKLNLPNTYRNLIENQIKVDYTMAYADEPGFRASTCTPFFWYDLERETVTDLLVCPTAVMDQTLRFYKKLSPTDALKEITVLLNHVKAVNGTFVSLWHNESISGFGVWKDWENVYIEMLRMATEISED